MNENYISSLQLLISSTAFTRIKTIGSRFPVHLTSFWGYEIPLSTTNKTADLLFCIDKPEQLKFALAADPALPTTTGLTTDPTYDGFRSFAIQWADETKKLRQSISNIWFEFDASNLSDAWMKPNFFYAPKEGTNPLAMVYHTHHVFDVILQKQLPKTVYQLLLNCAHLLKGRGWISQIGMMLARNEQYLRLFIQDIPRYGIIPYLKALPYHYADRSELVQQVNTCYKYSKRVGLDIDILSEPGEKLGLECYFDSLEQALCFLDMLEEKKICCAEKYVLLKDHVRMMQFDKEKEYQHFFSHIKMVYHPDAGFTAKAYIGYAESSIARWLIRTKPLKSKST